MFEMSLFIMFFNHPNNVEVTNSTYTYIHTTLIYIYTSHVYIYIYINTHIGTHIYIYTYTYTLATYIHVSTWYDNPELTHLDLFQTKWDAICTGTPSDNQGLPVSIETYGDCHWWSPMTVLKSFFLPYCTPTYCLNGLYSCCLSMLVYIYILLYSHKAIRCC